MPKASQQRRVVLTEEEYQDQLSHVIQRQFYPDLTELQTQATLQQRRDVGDYDGAITVRRAARRLQEHEELVQQSETLQESGVRTEPRPLHLETLTGFHARVTSEDNAEFERVQQESIAKHKVERSRMLLLTESKRDANPVREVAGAPTPLLLASDAFNPSSTRPLLKDAPVENSLFFVPEAATSDNTQARVRDDDNEKEMKLLMPPPLPQGVAKHQLVEYIPKNQLEKRIEPSCTRFPRHPSSSLSREHQNQHFEGSTTDDDGGGSTSARSEWEETDLDSVVTPRTLHRERKQGQKRKARELETLVQMTPLIHPNDSPIVTWGSVAGTPLVVRPESDAVAEPTHLLDKDVALFRMPPVRSCEEAAERAERTILDRVRRAKEHRKPSITSKSRTTSLTQRPPSLNRPESARSRSAFGSALRSAYSASGSVRSSRRNIASATPELPKLT